MTAHTDTEDHYTLNQLPALVLKKSYTNSAQVLCEVELHAVGGNQEENFAMIQRLVYLSELIGKEETNDEVKTKTTLNL